MLRTIVSAVLFLSAISGSAQSKTLYEYLRTKGYTPIIQHNSEWVPGGIIYISYKSVNPQAMYVPPMQDFAAVTVAHRTEQLDFSSDGVQLNAEGATKGLAGLLNALGINLSGGHAYTFSGVSFETRALDVTADQIQEILDKRGATWAFLGDPSPDKRHNLKHKGRLFDFYDMFIIAEVDSATSASLTSDDNFEVSGNFNDDQSKLTACKVSDIATQYKDAAAAADDSKKKNAKSQDDQVSTPNAEDARGAQAGDGRDSGPSGEDSAKNKKNTSTVKDVADAATKAAKDAAPGVSIGVNQCSKHSAGFSSATPIPTAMKLIPVMLRRDGEVLLSKRGDYVSVPTDNPRKLKRVITCTGPIANRLDATFNISCRGWQ